MRSKIPRAGQLLLVSVILAVVVGRADVNICPVMDLKALSFDNIRLLIQNPACGIRSVNDVLAKLPNELTENFMLFYRSRSLQGPHEVDYLNPRALLYSGTTTRPFVLSFNGDPAQPGYKAIEMVEMHPEAPNNVFRYFEIGFPFNDDEVGPRTWAEVQSGVTYSRANPQRCIACHGMPARPIIPGYPDWEGAFGSLHVAAAPPLEQEGLEQFIAKVSGPKLSRYKNLSLHGLTEGNPEYVSIAPDINQWVAARDGANSGFHDLLGLENAIRVAALVQKTPDYSKMRYAVTAAFAGCERIDEYVPKTVRAQLLENMNNLASLRTKWQQAKIDSIYKLIANFKRLFLISDLVVAGDVDKTRANFHKKLGTDPDFERLQLDTLQIQGIQRADFLGGDLRMLMEGRGLKIDNWFTDLTQPTYRFHDGGGAADVTAHAIAATDPTFDPTLKAWFAHKDSEGGFAGPELDRRDAEDAKIRVDRCDRMKLLSLQDLSAFNVPNILPRRGGPVEDQNGYPLVFQSTCATCHDSQVPLCVSIPFGSPTKMAAWISDQPNLRKLQERVLSPDETVRMPPTRVLTDDELNSILKYIGNH